MKKTFTLYTLLLTLAGLTVNFALAAFARTTGIPLFLDSIGTLLVGALGGFIPGIAVGFASNFISSVSDPISRYYGILSIMIAAVASEMSRRCYFKKIKGYVICALICALIGGGLGSVLTWILYGFSFGQGISAPYAIFLFERFGISQFWAQFIADMSIDLLDKFVSFIPLYLVLRYVPRTLLYKFPLGYVYCGTA